MELKSQLVGDRGWQALNIIQAAEWNEDQPVRVGIICLCFDLSRQGLGQVCFFRIRQAPRMVNSRQALFCRRLCRRFQVGLAADQRIGR